MWGKERLGSRKQRVIEIGVRGQGVKAKVREVNEGEVAPCTVGEGACAQAGPVIGPIKRRLVSETCSKRRP
jgi:hypothetical protein